MLFTFTRNFVDRSVPMTTANTPESHRASIVHIGSRDTRIQEAFHTAFPTSPELVSYLTKQFQALGASLYLARVLIRHIRDWKADGDVFVSRDHVRAYGVSDDAEMVTAIFKRLMETDLPVVDAYVLWLISLRERVVMDDHRNDLALTDPPAVPKKFIPELVHLHICVYAMVHAEAIA